MAAEFDEVMPKVLSSLLKRVAERNDLNRRFDIPKISIFDGLSRPTISIENYLERIFKYATCSPSCYVIAYIYLDRFVQKQPLLPIHSFNVHRLIITSVLVSAKFMDDIFYNNAYYAKVGGIGIKEMNLLEVDFLFGLGFQLNVTPDTYHTYSCYLQKEFMLQHLGGLSPLIPGIIGRKLELHCCINEDHDSSAHQQQLAV